MGLDLWFTKEKDLKQFRKVNFLVAYFESIDLDIDNDYRVYVGKEDMEELLNRCNKVLSNHSLAEKLLPTKKGFFFGSTDYDDFYFRNVENVRDFLKKELLPEFDALEDDEHILFYINY